MSDLRKYQEVAAEAARLMSLCAGLRETISSISGELDPLENEAIKAEISGEERADGLKARFHGKRQDLQKSRQDLEEAAKRLRACQELLPELRSKAAGELGDAYRKPFERDLRAFVSAIRTAFEMEKLLEAQRQKIWEEFNSIDAPCPFSPWAPVLMRKQGKTNSERGWERFVMQMKAEGYDVGAK